jgi:hypothetical protein
MNKKQLKELADDFLVPLISGARLKPRSVLSARKDALVALSDPCTIKFKAEKSDNYRLVLHRSQPFEKKKEGTLTESAVVKSFVRVVKAMKNGLQSWYKADLRSAFPRRVVVKAICEDRVQEEAVLAVVDQLALWAGQQ